MTHVNAFPPYRHVSSRPISLADASSMLDKYLTNSEAHPHLHPDSVITPAGVTFSSHGGPTGGVVMHNLRRVAAGLRGEYMEPEATPEPEDQAEQELNTANGKRNKAKRKGEDATAGVEEDWMDWSEFEREEAGIEVGEIGPRTNAVEQGGEIPKVEASGGAEMEESGKKKRKKDTESKADKEARKKAKKQRNKEFRAGKEKARVEQSI